MIVSEFSVRTLNKMFYKKQRVIKGYADQALFLSLGSLEIDATLIEETFKKFLTGGKGFGLWPLWCIANDKTEWNDEENALCIASGPLGGAIGFPGAGKSTVVTISPLTGIPIDSNVGGHFGPLLKFAGFDLLVVTGKKRPKNAVILIDGLAKKVEIMEMDGLPRYSQEICVFLTRYFGEDKPQNISVIATGPGAENSLYGCLNFSWWDFKRKIVRCKQAGRGGTGAVMADKGIKAIVVRNDSSKMDLTPVYPELLKEVIKKYSREIKELDKNQARMSVVGTTHLTEIMGAPEFQLLPVNNFQFGTHPDVEKLSSKVFELMFDKGSDRCWKGCKLSCAHGIKDFVPRTGPFKDHKVWVDGPEYETIAALGSNLGIFDSEFVVEANFYCDTYGLDTISTGVSMAFAMECFERGLIDRVFTNGLDLRFGNQDVAMQLLHWIACGIGFGKIVGQGVRRMKKIFAEHFYYNDDHLQLLLDIGMESKGLEFSLYITRESLAQQAGYGLALKGAHHDEAWLIFEDIVRRSFPTDEDKAEALHWFPMWRTWFGLCGLCKLPWNDVVPEDNTDDPKVSKHVSWYCDYFYAVTGRKVTPDDLILMSERVYNFQRVFALRMGRGTIEDDEIPFRAMGPVTVEEYEARREYYDRWFAEEYAMDVREWETGKKIETMRLFRQSRYKGLRKAVYARRGWNANGIPTLKKVRELGIDFPGVVQVLRKHGVKE